MRQGGVGRSSGGHASPEMPPGLARPHTPICALEESEAQNPRTPEPHTTWVQAGSMQAAPAPLLQLLKGGHNSTHLAGPHTVCVRECHARLRTAGCTWPAFVTHLRAARDPGPRAGEWEGEGLSWCRVCTHACACVLSSVCLCRPPISDFVSLSLGPSVPLCPHLSPAPPQPPPSPAVAESVSPR